MSDKARDMAAKLDTRPPKSGGPSNWMCRCPAHDDNTPSLGIRASGNKLVYFCHAGCNFDQIASAIRSKGLDPFTGGPDTGWRPGDKPMGTTKAVTRGRTEEEEEEIFLGKFTYDPECDPNWITYSSADRPPPYGYMHIRYVYRNKAGLAMMIVHRYDKVKPEVEGPRKSLLTISPWTRNTDGKLMLPARPCPSPKTPYGAESLALPGTVWIVEGEKCRDRLFTLLGGRFPVLSTYGSVPWMSDLTGLLERPSITIPDFDKPGAKYALDVAGIAGKFSTRIPSIWRGEPGTAPPAHWDIGDDIAGYSKRPDSPVFEALTIQEFAAHVARCVTSDSDKPDIIRQAAAELAAD